jgi:hypothetical protein
MSDESLEQPSPLRCVPSFATGGTAMSELTRAQLMELANNMCGLGDYWGRVQQLLDHDAAQRERIAELEAADEIHLQMHDTARQQLTTLQARVQAFLDHDAAQRERISERDARITELEQECEQDHCDILVCTGCGRTSKHGWIGIVYESTPNSAEEYDTKCPECGSMSLDEDARSVVNELDVCKAQIATAEARVRELEGALQSIANNTCCDRCQEAALVARAALHTPEEQL